MPANENGPRGWHWHVRARGVVYGIYGPTPTPVLPALLKEPDGKMRAVSPAAARQGGVRDGWECEWEFALWGCSRYSADRGGTAGHALLMTEVGRPALYAMNTGSGSDVWLKVMVSYMMSLILAVATGSFRALFRNEVAAAKARGWGKGRAVGGRVRSRGAQRGAKAAQATTVGYAVRGRKRAGQAKTGVADRSYKHNVRGCLKGRALARRAGGRRVGAVKWRRAAAGAFRPIGGPAPASECRECAVIEREGESARRWARRGWVGALGWKGGARKREAAPCQTGGMEEPDWKARRWCRVPPLPRRTEEAMGQARGPGVGT